MADGYSPQVEAMAHAIGGVLITRGSTYDAAIASLRALSRMRYALVYVGPGDEMFASDDLFDYSDDEAS